MCLKCTNVQYLKDSHCVSGKISSPVHHFSLPCRPVSATVQPLADKICTEQHECGQSASLNLMPNGQLIHRPKQSVVQCCQIGPPNWPTFAYAVLGKLAFGW